MYMCENVAFVKQRQIRYILTESLKLDVVSQNAFVCIYVSTYINNK